MEKIIGPIDQIIGPTWSSFAWRGLASIAFGAIALSSPGLTLAALTILFGTYALVDGVLAVVVAARPGYNPHRWLLLLDGVLGMGAGFVTLVWPSIGLLSLILVIGFRALFAGAAQMGAAWQLRNGISSPWLYAIGGALTIAFGVTALMLPGITARVLVTVIGVYAMFFGVAFLGLAYMTKRSSDRYLIEASAT